MTEPTNLRLRRFLDRYAASCSKLNEHLAAIAAALAIIPPRAFRRDARPGVTRSARPTPLADNPPPVHDGGQPRRRAHP